MSETLPREICVEVNGHNAKITNAPTLTSGTVGLPVRFHFDDAWDGLTKVAVFRAGDKVIDRLNIADETTVPQEVMQRRHCELTVGVYGINTEGTLVIPTVYASAGVIQPGADPSGDESVDPSAPAWQSAVMKDLEKSVSDQASAVGVGCFAGARAYRIIAKAADTSVASANGYYVLAADALPEEDILYQECAATMSANYEYSGSIQKVGPLETGLSGVDENGNDSTELTGFKVYVSRYIEEDLVEITPEHLSGHEHGCTCNTFRIPAFPLLGNVEFGIGAWAEGYQSKAVGTAAHAEGAHNTAQSYAHAEGTYNRAIGAGSHAQGAYNRAYGAFSHVGGVGNVSWYDHQTVIGQYNQNKEDTFFEVGVGTGATRSNGFEVKKDGSARVLRESTDEDAVVRYSQLERTAKDLAAKDLGFAFKDTEINLNFEDDTVGETPSGWTEVTPAPAADYYVRVKSDSAGKVLRVNSVNNQANYGSYFVQYSLPEKVTNLVLEYKVKLDYVNAGYHELYLPSINYTGVETNSNNNSTPLRLWGSSGTLYYSFTDAQDEVKISGKYNNTQWYNVRMAVDLRAGTRSLTVGTDSEILAQLTLPMTDKEVADWSTATLDRISTGAFIH